MKIKWLIISASIIALLSGAFIVQAQTPAGQPLVTTTAGVYQSSPATCSSGLACYLQTDANGNLKTTSSGGGGGAVTITATGVTSAQTKVAITTHNVYQQYLASNASRKGCVIQFSSDNTGDTGFVFFGSAPADTTTSFTLVPGATLSCNNNQFVLTDAIQLTSGADGSVFIVNSY